MPTFGWDNRQLDISPAAAAADFVIIHGRCWPALRQWPERPALVFADPPDNIGASYGHYHDKISDATYEARMSAWLHAALKQATRVVWFSINAKHTELVLGDIWRGGIAHPSLSTIPYTLRTVIWDYNFGRYQKLDMASCYRPQLRFLRKGHSCFASHIMEPSLRQTKYNDKRANPDGRIPGDVWHIPRVTGNSAERRQWIPTQHPLALARRIVKYCTEPSELVFDMFGGSGAILRACMETGRRCVSVDIDPDYCAQLSVELDLPIVEFKEP